MRKPLILESARKHGVSDEIIRHVFNNPVLARDFDDGLIMLIGPDSAGNLYEIGLVGSDLEPVVIHAMKARRKYLE